MNKKKLRHACGIRIDRIGYSAKFIWYEDEMRE